MIVFYVLAAINFIGQGAIAGRMEGGGILATDKWFPRLLSMSAFVIACAPFAGLWSLLTAAGVIGLATGHGQFMNAIEKAIASEKTDFVVTWVFGQDPRTFDKYAAWRGAAWANVTQDIKNQLAADMQAYGLTKLFYRSMFGMFITGTLVGLPAFLLCVAFGQYLIVGFFLLTGVVKSLSYILGWKVFNGTAPAEYMNGGGRNALCFLSLIIQLR